MIKDLELINYRNYENSFFGFSDKINVIVGNNAQGKTNILEAIFLISTSKSFRSKEDHLIRIGNNQGSVKCNIINYNKNICSISIYLTKGENKIIEINKKKINNTQLIGNLPVSLLYYNDLLIVQGDSSYRKKFLDTILSQINKTYFEFICKYNKVVKQRNFLLKRIKNRESKIELLDPWDEQIISLAPYIVERRLDLINRINEIIRRDKLFVLAAEKIDVKYLDFVLGEDNEFSLEKYKFNIIEKIKKFKHKEIIFGKTLFGPHSDDVYFEINDKNIRYYGSQGQIRTFLIILKIAEIEFMKSEIFSYPVILIDDIFAELDEKRKEILIGLLINKGQSIFTGTSLSEFNSIKDRGKIFRISEGKIVENDCI